MATSKPTLTDAKVKALKPRGSVYRVRDGINDPQLKGFGVTITPSSSRFFYLYFTSPEGQGRRYLPLGYYPQTSLTQARKSAREARDEIKAGIDPVEERARREAETKKVQAEADKRGTVAQLYDLYIRDLDMDEKRSAAQVRGIYERDIHDSIGDLYAADVTEEQCADIITGITDRGAEVLANRTLSYLKAAFKFGKGINKNHRWRKKAVPLFAIRFNPAAEIERAVKKERPGERYLSREEVRTLWNSMGVDAMETSQVLAIKLLLATGQRVEEVLGATWDEFDRESSIWAIPAKRRKTRAKVTEPHLVPLTGFHWQILDQIAKYSGSKYLFPRKDGVRPRTSDSLNQAVKRFCRPPSRIKGKSLPERMMPFSPRDCRRTWKTLAGGAGLDLEIRNRIQGHGFSDIGSQHYDRYDYLDPKRMAMLRWATWLETVIDNVPNVVPLEKRSE
ncbi:MAG: integrase arm-type DNA-binding domain-containing protein [Gammaproteobacteria bacterium]|nr:integrase arm-type DNA-binding domain-containing protein [Gammaproteobacteria bacterium]